MESITRRQFFLAASGSLALGVNHKEIYGLASSVDHVVAEAFSPLRLGEIMPAGWLKAQLDRDISSGYAGHLDEMLQDPKSKKYLLKPENNDFVTRAVAHDSHRDAEGYAIPPGQHSWWDAEMIGDWHDAVIRSAFLTGDTAARAKADAYVEAILKSQDDDGYIGIYSKGYRFHFHGPDAELWSQRCVLMSLLAYYEFSGRSDVLEAVERAGKLTISQYGPGTNYFNNPGQVGSGVAHGLMFLDVLEWLYRLTGDDRYRRAALSLYEDYNAATVVKNPDAQVARLLDTSLPLSGHGPDVMGYLRVPLLCYYLSGNPEYLQAFGSFVVKIQRHLGIGGSPLSGQGEEIKRTGQRPDMTYEYCSTFFLLHSLTWAMQKTGDPQYADMFERAFFNAAQGARFANGKALTYYSADERLWVRQHPPEGAPNPRYIYTAAFYPSCCHESGARVYPFATSALWMRSRDHGTNGLVAMLYAPSEVNTRVNDVPVSITERTEYPFAYEVEFSIKTASAVAFPIRFRVPAWSGEPILSATGAKVERDERGFLVVSKEWTTGDTIRLTLKPSIHGQKAVDGRTAVAYGPLVFAVPIAEKTEIIERFPEASGFNEFCSYQYDPADVTSAKRPLQLAGGKADYGFVVERNGASNPLRPWDDSPLVLRGEMFGAGGKLEAVKLRPMGCTLLRRTFFNISS